ncbi:MAG: DUF6782 family putative metallopeptidase [Candidatus Omnitrophota bacterium]|jgi:hypothetical protein
MKTGSGLKRISVGMFFVIALPLLAGWQRINLTDCMGPKPDTAAQGQKEHQIISSFPQVSVKLSPYQILEKTTSAFFKARSVHMEIETWLENPLFHIKSDFKSEITNHDDYRTTGRVSVSLLLSNGISTSQWVQTYMIRGIPFTWDLNKREWKCEQLKISAKDAQQAVEYGVLNSLASINAAAADALTLELVGVEKRNGKDCFVLQYRLGAQMFTYWNVVGEIKVKTWVDANTFLPRLLRAEGKLGDMYILQTVTYSDFGVPVVSAIPAVVEEKVTQEKEKLKGMLPGLTQAVMQIRGWVKPETIQVEYKDRVSFGELLRTASDNDFPEEIRDNEGFVMKWLGLVHQDADYLESMLNAEISSIAGLYDPKTKTIFIGDWLPPHFAEVVAVHELAHAFQDKNYDIEKFSDRLHTRDNFDLAFARQSLIEGDATAVMLEYILNKDDKKLQNLEDVFTLLEDKFLKQSQYAKQNIRYNVYGYGARFIQAYLRQFNWSDINAVYTTPPVSMEEIMHPHKYVGREIASEKDVPVVEESVKVPLQWKKIYETTLGEFTLLISLNTLLDKETSDKSVSGWQGDRVMVYENSQGNRLIRFVSFWDTIDDALEFAQGQKQWLQKKYPGISVEENKRGVFKEGRGDFFSNLATKELFAYGVQKNQVTVMWGKGLDKTEFESIIGGKDLNSEQGLKK